MCVLPGHNRGPPVDHLRRAGGRLVDREHEHGAGRQQDAVPGQQRAHQVHALHPHALRGPGPGRRLPSHRQQVRPFLTLYAWGGAWWWRWWVVVVGRTATSSCCHPPPPPPPVLSLSLLEVWRVTCIEVCDGGMAGHLY